MKIGFVGLGHLGKDAAEVIAEHHDVIGYDIREDIDVGVTVSSSLEFAVKDKEVDEVRDHIKKSNKSRNKKKKGLKQKEILF